MTTTLADMPLPPPGVPADALALIRRDANELVELEQKIEDAEKTLKGLTDRKKTLEETTLPELMLQAGVSVIGVGNRVVEVTPLVEASLPREDTNKRAAALEWLMDNGHGGVIKRELLLDLPKGDEKTLHLVVDAIKAAAPKLRPVIEATVHASTYKALAKKLVTSGATVPMETLGIFLRNKATIVNK